MKQNQDSWAAGYYDARMGKSINYVVRDRLAYMAGRVEGEAERKRRIKERVSHELIAISSRPSV